MKKNLFLLTLLFLLAIFSVQAQNWEQILEAKALGIQTEAQYGNSVSTDGDYAAISAYREDGNEGAVYICKKDYGGVGNWGQLKRISRPVDATGMFGMSVHMEGDYLIVGSSDVQSTAKVYVYKKDDGGADNWGLIASLTPVGLETRQYFGTSVSMDGDYVVVGAYGYWSNTSGIFISGKAYVFKKDASDVFTEIATLEQDDVDKDQSYSGDKFGQVIDISGGNIIVGAPAVRWGSGNGYADAGKVYIYKNDGTDNFSQIKILTNYLQGTKRFGESVALNGNYVVVGSPKSLSYYKGAIYIHKKDEGGTDNWSMIANRQGSVNYGYFGYSVAYDGTYIAVGKNNTSNTGAISIYKQSGDVFTTLPQILPSDAADGDNFGNSIAISGNNIIAGSYKEDPGLVNAGSAYMFQNDGADNYAQIKKFIALDIHASDEYGTSVNVNSNYAVIGVMKGDSEIDNAGCAYVFKNNGTEWGQITKLSASDGSGYDGFGGSASIDDNYAFAGSKYNDALGKNMAGAVYVYKNDGADNYSELKKLIASDAAASDLFGVSVSNSGDYLIAGAYYDDDGGSMSGSAYIFKKDQGGIDNWGELVKITAYDPAASDFFGEKVSISGDYAAVGAKGQGIGGSVYIFKNDGADNWGELIKIQSSDMLSGDNFGNSVHIQGDYLIVGAYYADPDLGTGVLSNAGSVYIFKKDQGGIDNWGQIAKINASDAETLDNFGTSVSISNDYVVVGAEDEGTGGSVYTFLNDGADNYIQMNKLELSNIEADDQFGHAVSLSGNYMFAGANFKDNEGLANSGSAYVYEAPAEPIILSQPTNKEICENTNTDFSISALNATSYQWQEDAGSGFADITNGGVYSNATTATLSITDATYVMNTYQYRCVTSNTEASFESDAAVLTVNPATSITTQLPANTSVCVGSAQVVLTGDASGTGTVTYQWYNSSGIMTGYTNTVLSLNTISGNSSTYYYISSSDCGSAQSDNAVVFIGDDTNPTITSTHVDKTVDANASCEASLPNYTGNVTATDNCDATLTITQMPVATTTISGATNEITLTVTDDDGNSTEVKFNVVVEDVTNPVTPTLLNVTGECSATATVPTTNDNCSGTVTGTTSDALTYSTQGTHTITWNFDDGNGNTINVNQDVVINDITNPVTPTLGDVTGECSATAIAPTTTDACVGTVTGTTSDALTYSTQGTHIVTWNFDDGNGNSINVNQNVVIEDVTDPATPTLANVTGECSATATAPTTTDACAGTITGTSSDDLTYTTQGTHTITWNFADGNGNSINVTQDVVVTDVTNPTPDVVTLTDVIVECELTSLTAPTATDNCAGVITGTHNATLPITIQGTTTVTWTYNDDNGNAVIQTQEVVVDDVTAPVPDVASLTNVTAECEVTTLTAPIATDNCEGTITGTHDATLPITSTTVITWTYDDGNGNAEIQTQNVVINDITDPIPDVASLTDVTAECEVVTLTTPTATDNCVGSVTATHNAILPITAQGTTTVTWTYDDGNGNVVIQTQDVVIDDVTNPVITSTHNNQFVDANSNCEASLLDYTGNVIATDNCDLDLTVTQLPIAGTIIIGMINNVTITVTDDSGNTDELTFNVELEDNTAPEITSIHNNQIVSGDGNCQFTILDYTNDVVATDNCDTELSITQSPSVGEIITGIVTVTLTVADNDGNSSNVNFDITVEDDINPVLAVQNFTVELDASGNASIAAYDIVTSASDNCTIADTTLSQFVFDCSDVATPINIDVTLFDAAGNSVTEIAIITVEDNINPIITCIGNQTVTANQYNVYVVEGTEFDPSATNDNCGVASTENDFNNSNTLAGEELEEGTHTITWTVTDENGNEATCSYVITVNAYVGISDILNNEISIYPNPTNGILNINFTETMSIRKIELVNVAGKVIYNSQHINENTEIDLTNHANGIYFIKVQTEDGVYIEKIIKY